VEVVGFDFFSLPRGSSDSLGDRYGEKGELRKEEKIPRGRKRSLELVICRVKSYEWGGTLSRGGGHQGRESEGAGGTSSHTYWSMSKGKVTGIGGLKKRNGNIRRKICLQITILCSSK